MFSGSSRGQVAPVVLIFGILFFVLMFHLGISDIESRAVKGIRKSGEVIYKNYEKREKELAKVNFVRIHAYNLSDTNLTLNDYEERLEDKTSEVVDFSYFDVKNYSETKCLVNLTLARFRPEKSSVLIIPSCP